MVALALAGCVHVPRAPEIGVFTPAAPPSVLIRDVRVFTATADGVLEHRDVRLADGRIEAVAPAGSGLAGDVVVDGAGLTLMPGLVDLHVHLALYAGPPWFLAIPDAGHNARAMVDAGVTTVLDLGGNPGQIAGLTRKIAAGRWVGPRIVYAGQGLTVAGGYPLSMLRDVYGPLAYASTAGRHFRAVDGTEAIVREVDRLADAGAGVIKLVVASIPPADPPTPRLSEAQVVAATARAHARGLKVAAHIDDAEDARICARAGVDLLAHGVETSGLTADDLVALKASGIAVAPTLVNWHRFDELTASRFTPTRSERRTTPPAVLDSFAPDRLETHRDVLEDSTFVTWAEALQAHRAERIGNVATLWRAGVPIRVGSDAGGSIGTFPGAIHEELRLLADAGVPAEVVLEAATRGNARFLDPDADYGAVAPGRIADLVLVACDPVAELRCTEDIVQVWVGGVPVR